MRSLWDHLPFNVCYGCQRLPFGYVPHGCQFAGLFDGLGELKQCAFLELVDGDLVDPELVQGQERP